MPEHYITFIGGLVSVGCGMYLVIATDKIEFGMSLISAGILAFGIGRKLDRLDK